MSVNFSLNTNKSQVVQRKTAWERQKEEKAAKQRRDEEDTERALAEFKAEFGVSDEEDNTTDSKLMSTSGNNASVPQDPVPVVPRGGGGRHFASKMRNSGPGSLEPQRPQNNKRRFDGLGPFGRDQKREHLDSKDVPHAKNDIREEFREDDMVGEDMADEEVLPRLKVKLSNLPPTLDEHVIKSFFPQSLKVTKVEPCVPTHPSAGEKPSKAIIATFDRDTREKDVHDVVTALRNKYLGKGYFLDIDRHFDTTAFGGNYSSSFIKREAIEPFGARADEPALGHRPDSLKSSFAPPTSLGGSRISHAALTKYVKVLRPLTLEKLRLVHMVLEKVIEKGEEFENLLLQRPEVIEQERWAWIWDPISRERKYYQFRLRELLAGAERCQKGPIRMFSQSAEWIPPKESLKFEFATCMEDFPSYLEYPSSDDDGPDANGSRQFTEGRAPPPEEAQEEEKLLNPREKAKLVWLLATLPQNPENLTRADVAAISYFVCSHSDRGLKEVVRLLISNIEQPFCFTGANPDWKKKVEQTEPAQRVDSQEHGMEREDESIMARPMGTEDQPPLSGAERQHLKHWDRAKLVGLYIVSDVVLSSQKLSGIPMHWRISLEIKDQLIQFKVFSQLGRVPLDLGMGVMTKNRWRNQVKNVLDIWGEEAVFTSAERNHFLHCFENPPLTAEEQEAEDQKLREREAREKEAAKKKKKKPEKIPRLDGTGDNPNDNLKTNELANIVVVDGEDEEQSMDVDTAEGDIASPQRREKLYPDVIDYTPGKVAELSKPKAESTETLGETAAARARRLRPKAEDLFVDADGE
ncbi:hypothetical protein K469DRAFT_717796 [Zopfia rhizophila CBS 207.26]|uniref:CID domain-containing protein n=1 Tax=Zopfia rhizophila CBS 207.26 TaxID=1314779 RepID=A0A6A6DKR0_9PEZI|nr:hypothetical protein K469DRAFT_717796 [Zopfia rhizophila CBS 207.26]